MARKTLRRRALRKKARKPALAFNHAMIYVRDVGRALEFYRDVLGLKVISVVEGGPGYARLRAPSGRGTIALHGTMGEPIAEGSAIRLYFEVKQLDAFCRSLAAQGVVIRKMPAPMPWGWRHAYLDDPDGHEVSLYWAGEKRLRG